jgi:hypothetical protein
MSTTTHTEPTYYGVVTGPYEEDRQVYADYGDGSYISTHAEQMATREFLRLSGLGVRCGIWRGPELLGGEDMIFAGGLGAPAVEHKTRTWQPRPETGHFDKRGRPMHDRSGWALCTCGWVAAGHDRVAARKLARAHREEALKGLER